jgi:hypothetical protein
MDEADAVVQPKRGVAKTGGLRALQLVVDAADELLVLGYPIGLELVANHYLPHCFLLYRCWMG